MIEEGQKYTVACCPDGYTDNRDWKPVECSEQCCCTFMPGPTEDKSSCTILHALKFIQFVVRDTSKEGITVV